MDRYTVLYGHKIGGQLLQWARYFSNPHDAFAFASIRLKTEEFVRMERAGASEFCECGDEIQEHESGGCNLCDCQKTHRDFLGGCYQGTHGTGAIAHILNYEKQRLKDIPDIEGDYEALINDAAAELASLIEVLEELELITDGGGFWKQSEIDEIRTAARAILAKYA